MCVCVFAAYWSFDAAVGDFVIVSLVRRIRLNLIGYVNKMDNKRKAFEAFYNNPKGRRLSGRPKS